MEKQVFGDALKSLRKKRGLSKFALAKKAMISASEVDELEKGRRTPRATTISKLAEALGVSHSSLMKGSIDELL